MAHPPVLVIDTGLGNIKSVTNLFARLGEECIIAQEVPNGALRDQFSMLVVPGVGAFDEGMRRLGASGWTEALQGAAAEDVPILGLCLGMQMLCDASEEGSLSGLGLIPGAFRRFPKVASSGRHLKVPHMGWNHVRFDGTRASWADGLTQGERYYFVHSFRYFEASGEFAVGWTEYGDQFASVIARDRNIGLQFHPEKSHKFGERLIRRILDWAHA